MNYEMAVDKLDAYMKYGEAVGGFLMACLANDLQDAIGQADDSSLEALPLIAKYIWNTLPAECHGSRNKVRVWQERKFNQ